MLILPDIEGEPNFRIVATDPGTKTLGVAVLDYNRDDGSFLLEHATTLRIDKLFPKYPLVIERHGERVAKMYAIQMAVYKILEAWTPSTVVSEGPYMGSFPSAYAALVECVESIRRAIRRYDALCNMTVIDPASVKKSIGVSGKSGDKSLVAKALAEAGYLRCAPGVSLADLDEHATDAVAVGIAYTRFIAT